MNMKTCKSKVIYCTYIEENYMVTTEVVGDKINITKIEESVLDEYDFQHEYYAKVKYTKSVTDINNIEKEIEIFIQSRFSKMVCKLEEIKVKLETYKAG